ncbi:MAG: LysM peptidoglycan-binding domain-containing protein [Gammaproteobacteria bacterium]|nr:LysM peptidoglycan-binding domain-containing protein [Gammaproteobacteria bacterium]
MTSSYEVQSGDTLSGIASRSGSSVDALLAANPQIDDPDRILVGQRINLDGGEQLANAELTHVVRLGETLSGIAQQYGIGVSDLTAANPQISNPDLIYPDDRINVPLDAGDRPSGGAASTYIVQPGDTLSGIAAQRGSSAAAIAAANGIANPDLIYPGDTLVVPGSSAAPPNGPTVPAPETGTPNAPPGAGEFNYEQIAGVAGNANVTPEFIAEVEAMAQRLDTRPEYLMAVMSFETGGSFSPSVQNPVSDATGLIQFLPSTARGLGTSVAELKGMTATQQLSVVEQYFRQYEGQLGSLEGVYTSVLSGTARPDPEAVLFSQGTAAYTQNSGLDFNSDGRITSGEATSAVASRLYGGVSAVQQQLMDRGYGHGAGFVDGQFGPDTAAAISDFQQANGLNATGLLDDATGRALFAADAAPAPNAPSAAPEYDPYTVYSTGGGTVRITSASQLRPHHDYQTQVREGQTLEVRDVTIAHAGQAHNTQTIPAPVSGEVVSAGPMGTAGNAVVLRGDDGGLVYLFHMTRVDVSAGVRVNYGDAVGIQGTTGHSTGEHVHIEASSATIDRWVGDLLDGRFDGAAH